MPIGTVKFFNESKGYGFIAPDQAGNDAFVHITALERAGMRTLRENDRLSYDLEQDQRGRTSAVNLRLADETTQSPPQQVAGRPEESELAGADVPEPVQQ